MDDPENVFPSMQGVQEVVPPWTCASSASWPRRCETIVVWFTCLSVLLLCLPIFIRLPFNVPGIEGFTPQKVVQPIVFIAVMITMMLRRRVPRGADLPLHLLAVLAGWVFVSILVNRHTDLTNNLRVWLWLLMAVGLAMGVARAAAEVKSATRLLRCGGVAVLVVVVCGFVEVYGGPGSGAFFQFFRPDWAALGLTGPGPQTVLPVRAMVGNIPRLMSTLGNDASFFLPLGSILAASVYLACAKGRRAAALGWLFATGVTGWAVILTMSRTAIGITFAGLFALAVLTCRRSGRWAVVPWLPLLLSMGLLVVNVSFTSTLLAAKFRGLDALFVGGSADDARPATLRHPNQTSEALATSIGRWSVYQRSMMASVALDLVRGNPVFGVGLWNFRARLYEQGGQWDQLGLRADVADVQDPHSFFLWLAGVAGIPAALLGIAIFTDCLVSLGGHWWHHADDRVEASGLISAWIVLAGFAIFGFTFLTTTALGVFATLVGATAGYLTGRSTRPAAC